MNGSHRSGAVWRDGLIVIDGRARQPRAEAELRRLGLLCRLENELSKTAEEVEGIRASVDALNAVREDLGLEAVVIDPARIHIADEREFWTRWGTALSGFVQFGHAFVPRRYLFVSYLQDLTHEIVHLASHMSSSHAIVDPSRAGEQAIVALRSGLLVFTRRGGAPDVLFKGLNEGVTETIAGDVRRRLLMSRPKLFKPGHGDILLGDRTYAAHVCIIDELIRLLGVPIAAARRRLLIDYFEQSDAFLKVLARRSRGTVTMLRRAESPTDMLAIAEHLGAEAAATSIRRLMAYRPKR